MITWFWSLCGLCIVECVIALVVWCCIGVLILRSKIGWGDVIPMIHYNYPALGLAMLVGSIVLWPIYLLWVLGSWSLGVYLLWWHSRPVKWTISMPRKTHDIFKSIMAREGIATKSEYMQRACGIHDYLTEKRGEGYKLYLKKDDETEYHELDLQ